MLFFFPNFCPLWCSDYGTMLYSYIKQSEAYVLKIVIKVGEHSWGDDPKAPFSIATTPKY